MIDGAVYLNKWMSVVMIALCPTEGISFSCSMLRLLECCMCVCVLWFVPLNALVSIQWIVE